MPKEYQIVSEQIIDQQGSFKRVRRWYEGHHSELGVLTSGWQGEPQTIREVDIISPVVTVKIYERDSSTSE